MPHSRTFNFTKKALAALPTPEGREVFHDSTTEGLGLLVRPTGRKSFFWFRRVNGDPMWITIGNFPDLGVEQAR
ncbi:MAG: Arm DNA-binding domain-containing protein, partial [Terriglobales bacterium]